MGHLTNLSLVRHHRQSACHKHVHDVHSLHLRATAVATQVEHQRRHALIAQVDKRTAHLLGTALGELRQADIACVALTHTVVGYRRSVLYLAACNLHLHLFACARTPDLQQERRTRIATQTLADVLRVLACHHRVVDAQYHVALLQTCLLSRCTGIGLVDDRCLLYQMVADECADAAVLARDKCLQVFLLRIVLRVGIQRTQHRLNTRAYHLVGIKRVNIHQVQVLIQLVEDIQVFGYLQIVVLRLLGRRHERSQSQKQQCNMFSHFSFLPFYVFTFHRFLPAKLHDYR